MSSIGGQALSAGWGIYCATKFAVEAISESMSTELEPLGIRTTVIELGYFHTTPPSSTNRMILHKQERLYGVSVNYRSWPFPRIDEQPVFLMANGSTGSSRAGHERPLIGNQLGCR